MVVVVVVVAAVVVVDDGVVDKIVALALLVLSWVVAVVIIVSVCVFVVFLVAVCQNRKELFTSSIQVEEISRPFCGSAVGKLLQPGCGCVPLQVPVLLPQELWQGLPHIPVSFALRRGLRPCHCAPHFVRHPHFPEG